MWRQTARVIVGYNPFQETARRCYDSRGRRLRKRPCRRLFDSHSFSRCGFQSHIRVCNGRSCYCTFKSPKMVSPIAWQSQAQRWWAKAVVYNDTHTWLRSCCSPPESYSKRNDPTLSFILRHYLEVASDGAPQLATAICEAFQSTTHLLCWKAIDIIFPTMNAEGAPA